MVGKKVALFFGVFIGLLLLSTVAEKLGVPNYDLPFGWHKFTYDTCTTKADYNTASKHCKEVCPQQFAPGTRGNGFPFTVDYSDCDPQGGRANPIATILNLLTPLAAATAITLLAMRRKGAAHA